MVIGQAAWAAAGCTSPAHFDSSAGGSDRFELALRIETAERLAAVLLAAVVVQIAPAENLGTVASRIAAQLAAG